jgi:hypothetical protein
MPVSGGLTKACFLTYPSNSPPGSMSKSRWSGVAQIVEKKVVGDAGFEPVTFTDGVMA